MGRNRNTWARGGEVLTLDARSHGKVWGEQRKRKSLILAESQREVCKRIGGGERTPRKRFKSGERERWP